MVVYLDVYFGLNLWMDVVLIGITAALSGERIKIWRMAVAACMGAATACILLAFGRKWQLIGMVISAGVMMRVIFPYMRRKMLIRVVITYISVAIFIGGVVNWWYFGVKYGVSAPISGAKVGILGTFTAVTVVVWIKVNRQKKRRERYTYRVLLRIQGRDILTVGFLDSGNCLRDEKGRPVHICEKSVITGEGVRIEESFSVTYNTLSGEGRLNVVRADRLLVPELGVDEEGALIGLTEERLFMDKRCHMLLNSVLGEGH